MEEPPCSNFVPDMEPEEYHVSPGVSVIFPAALTELMSLQGIREKKRGRFSDLLSDIQWNAARIGNTV